ncbi:MAG TPA: AAA family ATPase, partial [Noviherbaspirillum sp.]|uniref:AAA family ATPase n=1 Tax=Noviherbaspirillum sp. TaxID=1926288 RepID=UPI002D2B54BC
MRITDISIPERGCTAVTGDDLGITSALHMPRLGKVVVLAGANGAGKTRLLKIISGFCNYLRKIGSTDRIRERLKTVERNIENWEASILEYQKGLKNAPNNDAMLSAMESVQESVDKARAEIVALNSQILHWQWITTAPPAIGAPPVFFVPAAPILQDAETFTPRALTNNADLCRKVGAGDTSVTVPSYLRVVLRAARNSKLALLEGVGMEEDKAAVQAGAALEELVGSLLGEHAKLTIDRDDHVAIFGRQDFSNALSDGQKVLLKLAVQLHAQKTDLANALVFLDEPENHLHPAVLNQVIDVLLTEVTTGQVWISTHSVPLIAKLSSLDPACIWYMKDGTVSHAGRKPEIVLTGLIGNEGEIATLRDFTDLPAKLAANRYAAQCLLDPTTVAPTTRDKQQTQMVGALDDTATGAKIRVLDYGAGQGRLLAALREAGRLDLVDYIAFDIEGNSNAACKREIEAVYGPDEVKNRFFTSISDVITRWGSVDIAIMCNVLHEIHPEDWIQELGPDSRLMELIKNDGFLLIVEDQRIPVGENAHDFGFIVFDTLQFQKLFSFSGDAGEDLYKKYDADEGIDGKSGRILAHRFSKRLALRFTRASQQDAMVDLYKTAAGHEHELRRRAKQK